MNFEWIGSSISINSWKTHKLTNVLLEGIFSHIRFISLVAVWSISSIARIYDYFAVLTSVTLTQTAAKFIIHVSIIIIVLSVIKFKPNQDNHIYAECEQLFSTFNLAWREWLPSAVNRENGGERFSNYNFLLSQRKWVQTKLRNH